MLLSFQVSDVLFLKPFSDQAAAAAPTSAESCDLCMNWCSAVICDTFTYSLNNINAAYFAISYISVF